MHLLGELFTYAFIALLLVYFGLSLDTLTDWALLYLQEFLTHLFSNMLLDYVEFFGLPELRQFNLQLLVAFLERAD